MADPSFTSLQVSVVGTISKERGWDFYEKLRGNDIMIVQGNQQVSDMLKRGERLIAVGALDSYAAEDRKAGHQMKTLYPTDGVFIIPSPTSVVKDAPHPERRQAFRGIHDRRRCAEDLPGRRRLFGAHRHRGAGKARPISRPEDTRCRLRLYRERRPSASRSSSTRFSDSAEVASSLRHSGWREAPGRNPYPYLPGFWAPPFDCRRFLGSRFRACPLCGARNDGNHAHFHHSGGDNSAAPARQCNYRLLEGVA